MARPLFIRNLQEYLNSILGSDVDSAAQEDFSHRLIRELSFSHHDGWTTLMTYLRNRREACITEAEQSTSERRAEFNGASRELRFILSYLEAISNPASIEESE